MVPQLDPLGLVVIEATTVDCEAPSLAVDPENGVEPLNWRAVKELTLAPQAPTSWDTGALPGPSAPTMWLHGRLGLV